MTSKQAVTILCEFVAQELNKLETIAPKLAPTCKVGEFTIGELRDAENAAWEWVGNAPSCKECVWIEED